MMIKLFTVPTVMKSLHSVRCYLQLAGIPQPRNLQTGRPAIPKALSAVAREDRTLPCLAPERFTKPSFNCYGLSSNPAPVPYIFSDTRSVTGFLSVWISVCLSVIPLQPFSTGAHWDEEEEELARPGLEAGPPQLLVLVLSFLSATKSELPPKTEVSCIAAQLGVIELIIGRSTR